LSCRLSLFRWWLFLKGISQFLRGRAEYAQVAADGNKGRAPFQIAARIGFNRRQNAARFAVLLRGKNVLDSALYFRVGSIAQMSQRSGQIAWADKIPSTPSVADRIDVIHALLALNLHQDGDVLVRLREVIRHGAKHIGAVRNGHAANTFWRIAG
jgi:hypothetical protein